MRRQKERLMVNRLPPEQPDPQPVRGGSLAWRFAAIGACVIVPALAFAYVGGWLDPGRLSADKIIDTFQAGSGVHPGFRRNHAKGVCVAGYFDSNGAAAAFSTAQVLAAGRTPVVGRFAIPGGNPYAPDSSAPIRSMALRFTQANGEQWRTGMNDMPVFPVSTPEAFFAQLQATSPDPATGKPDPAKVKAFFASHPETAPFLQWVKTAKPSASFATEGYWSLNAFYLVDASGVRHAVRWKMEPEASDAAGAVAPKETDYLDNDLRTRLSQGPLRWHLVFTLADPGDPVDNATLAWPAGRHTVDAGTLVLDATQSQDDGPCRDVNYDPLVLPTGIQRSDDPLLPARSAAYAESYARRTAEETHAPGATSASAH
jgi:catalase